MNISGMNKCTLTDFPNHVACILFTPGCNYDCFYCHNRTLLNTNELINPNEIDLFLRKRVNLIDGVVISGGEPTLQPDLIEYIIYLRNIGYKIKLDTNGSNPDIIREIVTLKLCDYIAIDYKSPKGKYTQYCGDRADPTKTIETINILNDSDILFEVRTTVFPQLSKEDLILMTTELPEVPKFILNEYKCPPEYKEEHSNLVIEKGWTTSQLLEILPVLQQNRPNIMVSKL